MVQCWTVYSKWINFTTYKTHLNLFQELNLKEKRQPTEWEKTANTSMTLKKKKPHFKTIKETHTAHITKEHLCRYFTKENIQIKLKNEKSNTATHRQPSFVLWYTAWKLHT